MTKLEELEARFAEIEEQMRSLGKLRGEVLDQLAAERNSQVALTNSILNAVPGQYIVAVAKSPDYHFNILELYHIKEDETLIIKSLKVDDYDISYHVRTTNWCNNALFHNKRNEMYLYNVPKKVFDSLSVRCENLEFNSYSLKNIDDSLKAQHFASIHID